MPDIAWDKRFVCSVCKRPVATKSDGTLHDHGLKAVRCDGSGRRPSLIEMADPGRAYAARHYSPYDGDVPSIEDRLREAFDAGVQWLRDAQREGT